MKRKNNTSNLISLEGGCIEALYYLAASASDISGYLNLNPFFKSFDGKIFWSDKIRLSATSPPKSLTRNAGILNRTLLSRDCAREHANFSAVQGFVEVVFTGPLILLFCAQNSAALAASASDIHDTIFSPFPNITPKPFR